MPRTSLTHGGLTKGHHTWWSAVVVIALLTACGAGPEPAPDIEPTIQAAIQATPVSLAAVATETALASPPTLTPASTLTATATAVPTMTPTVTPPPTATPPPTTTPAPTSTMTPPPPTATSPPRREPTPSPPPATSGLPRGKLSPSYSNPKVAIRRAFAEVYGSSASMSGPLFRQYDDFAVEIVRMYHLATADVGDFNADTTNLDRWLVSYLRLLAQPNNGEYRQFTDHMRRQIRTAITQPTSRLGQRIRLIEADADPDFRATAVSQGQQAVGGPLAYWYFVFGGMHMVQGSLAKQSFIGHLRNLTDVYNNRRFGGDPSLSFGDFLAETDFLKWFS